MSLLASIVPLRGLPAAFATHDSPVVARVHLTLSKTANHFSHLQRDWEVEHQQWERFLERVHNAEETERMLKSHPQSWENLKGEAKPNLTNEDYPSMYS